MGKIFCIIGKSASGKDTIFKKIKNDKTLNLKGIIEYTTRKKREDEIDGIDYNFISANKFKDFIDRDLFIEYRTYNTNKGKLFYGINKSNIDTINNNYLVITPPKSYFSLKDYFGEEVVIPVYIYVSDDVRLLRSIKRESKEKTPNFSEVCRRFLSDEEDFKEVEDFTKIRNYIIDVCCEEVKNTIIKELK